MAKKVVLAGACRTAIGTMGGTLSTTPAPELGAIVIKEALKRAGVAPEAVDQVYMGCVIPVSYTHLDVYKRQLVYSAVKTGRKLHLAAAFGLHFAVDFLTVICAAAIPTWVLELGLLLVVAVICVVVYQLVYVQMAEKK